VRDRTLRTNVHDLVENRFACVRPVRGQLSKLRARGII
jgi:hypothetical protein